MCHAMVAAAALGGCLPQRESAGAPQALAQAELREVAHDGSIIHWGKPVEGLVLGIAAPRGPHLLPAPSSVRGQRTVFVEPYLKNVSLQTPADCDGSVRIMSAMFSLDPLGPGGGGGWASRRLAAAPLAEKLLAGGPRHMEKLSASFDPLELAKETGAYACLFPDSGEGEGRAREWITGRLTLSLHFTNAEGELVGGSWSGTLEARAPVDFAPLRDDATEDAHAGEDAQE